MCCYSVISFHAAIKCLQKGQWPYFVFIYLFCSFAHPAVLPEVCIIDSTRSLTGLFVSSLFFMHAGQSISFGPSIGCRPIPPPPPPPPPWLWNPAPFMLPFCHPFRQFWRCAVEYALYVAIKIEIWREARRRGAASRPVITITCPHSLVAALMKKWRSTKDHRMITSRRPTSETLILLLCWW